MVPIGDKDDDDDDKDQIIIPDDIKNNFDFNKYTDEDYARKVNIITSKKNGIWTTRETTLNLNNIGKYTKNISLKSQ